MKIPRLVIAGTTSNVGKTSITCAIIYSLKKNGFTVQPFKVGPDYIDPSYLDTISKNKTRNLDAWIMTEKEVLHSFVRNSNSDVSIIEGVMGYYDGVSGNSNFSSTFHTASILKAPVILVIDASKTARSIGAIVFGFMKFQKNSRIVGVILNKIGSKKHEDFCKNALSSLKIPVLGIIPRDPELILESRHLGLIPTIEQTNQEIKITKIAKRLSDFLKIDEIIKICKKNESLPKPPPQKSQKIKCSIGVALDNSFNFYYADNLDSLRKEGAQLKFFSPISDHKIPNCDGLFIGGGFPEILASPLEKNSKMKKSLLQSAQDDLPIYAECGGLMYLTKSITYGKKKFRTVGLFDAETIMTNKMTLNYTNGIFITKSILSEKSLKFHGHEFHYSKIDSISSDAKLVSKLYKGNGIKDKKDGLIIHNTLASYGHLYFDYGSFSKNFVKSCIDYSRR